MTGGIRLAMYTAKQRRNEGISYPSASSRLCALISSTLTCNQEKEKKVISQKFHMSTTSRSANVRSDDVAPD